CHNGRVRRSGVPRPEPRGQAEHGGRASLAREGSPRTDAERPWNAGPDSSGDVGGGGHRGAFRGRERLERSFTRTYDTKEREPETPVPLPSIVLRGENDRFSP